MTFTWQNGRQLASVSQNGTVVATYAYDADGLRTSKTVGETVTEYYWMNGTLYGQKTGSEYIFFLYDENGSVYGFVVKNSSSQSHYYYEFNLQGDIIGIIDSSGTKVVEYTYGAWGDILSITGTMADTIGQKNPLRYRGYYYDGETGFYYLQSRYYDAEICRFLNADGYVSTGVGIIDNNMYSYCGNNPINRIDPTGQFLKELWDTFTQTIQQASGYFGVAVGVSQVDTVVPGPADVVSGVLLLGGIIYCAGASAYTTITTPSSSISIPKTEDKTITVPKPRRDPVHHIVAKADPRAAESRQILRDVGIEPLSDSKNLVTLPQTYHASLHTTAYHNYVTERLRPVAGDKAGVVAVLALLKAEILVKSAMRIRWD